MNFLKIKSGLLMSLVMLLAIAGCKTRATSTAKSNVNPEQKLGWELGSQAYTFRLFTFFEAVKKIDSCNLRYVEAFPGQLIGGGIEGKMDPNMSETTRKAILSKLKAANVKVIAFGVTKGNNEAEWVKLFEFCKAMGIHTITSEPDEKFIPLLSKLADKYEINVAIHNHPNPSHYWNPDIILNAVKGHSKRIGACADIGHWVRSGLDPVACLKKLEGRVLHSHMKDLHEMSKKGHDVHWGEGVCNIPGVIAELKRQNFKGGISAEYEYNWKSNSADVAASVIKFRNMVTKK